MTAGLILNKLLARFPKLTPVESVMVQDASAPDSVVFRIVRRPHHRRG